MVGLIRLVAIFTRRNIRMIVTGMLAITNPMVIQGRVFSTRSSHSPPKMATSRMTKVMTATPTTVMVTADLKLVSFSFSGRFIAAKLYQILKRLKKFAGGLRSQSEPRTENGAKQDHSGDQDPQSY